MSQLKSHDLADLDKYFQGNEAGYVLDFSNKTFADFFAEYLDVDIDNEEYSKEGTSKDKRLKYYLKIVDDKTALETITALEKNKSNTIFANNPKHTSALLDKIENIKNRLSDSNDAILIEKIVRPVSYDSKKYIEYLSRINKLKSIDPHKRGYDF